MALPRHEAENRIHPIFAFMLIMVLCASMALGAIRLYSLHIEQRISELNVKIEKYADYNAELERKLSALLSPGRIYAMARASMNMSPPVSEKEIAVRFEPEKKAEGENKNIEKVDKKNKKTTAELLSKLFKALIPRANAED